MNLRSARMLTSSLVVARLGLSSALVLASGCADTVIHEPDEAGIVDRPTDHPVSLDVATGCQTGFVLLYGANSCENDAVPRCQDPNTDACLRIECDCQGNVVGVDCDGRSATPFQLCTGPVVINEVVIDEGASTDFVELYNKSTDSVDISGWTLENQDLSNLANIKTFTLPASTVLAGGAYIVFDEATLGFGFVASDGVTLRHGQDRPESHRWTESSAARARCPNGIGALRVTTSVTKGAANTCAMP